jgi:mersacidin/lichenicidin family type 2 lantibiotic
VLLLPEQRLRQERTEIMSSEDIIRAWKGDEDEQDQDPKDAQIPANPAGEELTDSDLEKISGGTRPPNDTQDTCAYYCAESMNCA